METQLIDRPAIWDAIVGRLNEWRTDWRNQITDLGQVDAVLRRKQGIAYSDSEVFESLLLALLSNSTDWSKIQRIRGLLKDRLHGFDPAFFVKMDASNIESLYQWFLTQKAGSITLRKSLPLFHRTITKLMQYAVDGKAMEQFFFDALRTGGGNPIDLPFMLGIPGHFKLPGFGVALAAEAIRNLGFDVSKPDRHILRAAEAFGLVTFKRFPIREDRKSPSASNLELRNTMVEIERLAQESQQLTSLVDNAIWMLCAISGPHLNNDELRLLTKQNRSLYD